MARINRIDRDTADRLLSGRVAPDDAPVGFAATAQHLRAAAQQAPAAAPAPELLAAMSAAALVAPTPRRKSMISKLATTKVAVAAFGAIVLSASGAAAATGHLPDAAQHKVASIASHAGIDLPDSASSTATAVHKAQADTPPGPARGKAVSDAAHAANAARKAAKANPSATTGNATSDAAKAKADAKKAADDNHATTTTSGSPAPTTHGQSDATTHGNSAATTHGQSGQEHPTTTTSTTQP